MIARNVGYKPGQLKLMKRQQRFNRELCGRYGVLKGFYLRQNPYKAAQ